MVCVKLTMMKVKEFQVIFLNLPSCFKELSMSLKGISRFFFFLHFVSKVSQRGLEVFCGSFNWDSRKIKKVFKLFQRSFKLFTGISRLRCNSKFIVAWHSSELPEQKENFVLSSVC